MGHALALTPCDRYEDWTDSDRRPVNRPLDLLSDHISQRRWDPSCSLESRRLYGPRSIYPHRSNNNLERSTGFTQRATLFDVRRRTFGPKSVSLPKACNKHSSSVLSKNFG